MFNATCVPSSREPLVYSISMFLAELAADLYRCSIEIPLLRCELTAQLFVRMCSSLLIMLTQPWPKPSSYKNKKGCLCRAAFLNKSDEKTILLYDRLKFSAFRIILKLCISFGSYLQRSVFCYSGLKVCIYHVRIILPSTKYCF